MFKNPVRIILFLSLSVLALVAVFSDCSKPKSGNDRILFTTILPQKDFVQQIAGERFKVHALVGAGQNPHSYSPTPDQMVQLSKAKTFFRIGVEVEEGLLPKIEKSMPNLRIVDFRKGIELRDMIEEHHHDHEHGEKHDHHGHHHDDDHAEHDHEGHHHDDEHAEHDHHDDCHHHDGKDPHIWLSPLLVKQMALTIKDELIELDPDGRKVYEENLLAFHQKLDSLDAFIRTTLAPVKGTELFVFHPAFGYFTDEYGLIQKPVETGGKEPSARDLAKLIEEAREHKPKVIFVQPQYATKSAEALAAQINCAVVPINPLPEDYFKEMREMCTKIHEGLSGNEE